MKINNKKDQELALDYTQIITNSITNSNKKIAQNQGYFLAFFLAFLAYESNNLKIFLFSFFVVLMFVSAYFPKIFLHTKFFAPMYKIHNFVKNFFYLIIKSLIFLNVISILFLLIKFFKKRFLIVGVDRSMDSYFTAKK